MHNAHAFMLILHHVNSTFIQLTYYVFSSEQKETTMEPEHTRNIYGNWDGQKEDAPTHDIPAGGAHTHAGKFHLHGGVLEEMTGQGDEHRPAAGMTSDDLHHHHNQ
jgi:hypothetical protein